MACVQAKKAPRDGMPDQDRRQEKRATTNIMQCSQPWACRRETPTRRRERNLAIGGIISNKQAEREQLADRGHRRRLPPDRDEHMHCSLLLDLSSPSIISACRVPVGNSFLSGGGMDEQEPWMMMDGSAAEQACKP